MFQCSMCGKRFPHQTNMVRHKRTAHSGNRFKCDICGEEFKRTDNLKRHMKKHAKEDSSEYKQQALHQENFPNLEYEKNPQEDISHVEDSTDTGRMNIPAQKSTIDNVSHKALARLKIFPCAECTAVFKNKKTLTRHMMKHRNQGVFSCGYCSKAFYRYDTCKNHEIICNTKQNTESRKRKYSDAFSENVQENKKFKISQIGGGDDNKSIENEPSSQDVDPCKMTSAMKSTLKTYQLAPRTNQKKDLSVFLNGKRSQILKYLTKELEEKRGIKWYLNVKVSLVKHKADGKDETATPHFRSLCQTSTNTRDFEKQIQESYQKVMSSFAKFEREGSGWILDEILQLELCVAAYKPLQGSSYIPLPTILGKKKAIINIKNKDNKCFMWSVLAALHPVAKHHNPERIHHYQNYQQELNFENIDFPVTIDKVPLFEKQNSISVNIFGFEEGELFPLHITSERFDKHVNLLLFSKGAIRHYCLIKNLNTLLYHLNKRKARMYYCNYCLHGFIREDLLDEHVPNCQPHGPQKMKYPDEEHNNLQFKDFHKQLKVPFVIYADFECITEKISSASSSPEISSTEKYQRHTPCGFSYIVVSQVDDYTKPPVVYRGEDCVDKFYERLFEEREYIKRILSDIKPMEISARQEREFQEAEDCYICGDPLGADRVRDHCHLTGKFRGAAHNECNLNYQFTGRIPVLFHNLRSYDSHLLMQGLGKLQGRRINCIPNNAEKYITFSVDEFDFLDSLQFMNASLEKLVANLAKQGSDKFNILRKFIDEDKIPLLLRKGVYPYDYMDSFDKFAEQALPPKSAFYSVLKDEHISDDDYAHALSVFNSFQMNSLGDYHDLYLMSDVLLLADIFENFRLICLDYYKLDPCHFYTSPGLSWAACLKMTKVVLELITDPDMYLFVEEGLRGGISMISNRYSKANNPYVPNYDPSNEHTYIPYLDANNLYGWAMSQPLPTHGFEWLPQEEMNNTDFTTIPDDNDWGYILEADLEYPRELHDSHNDYPLAPEKKVISDSELSPYCQALCEKLNLGGVSVPKLVPNLSNKTKYKLHYRNLKLYVQLGMRVTKIHRVLAFQQSSWLKTYIDFNTQKRAEATNDFEKDFFKLQNNSIFGKTMENLRKRVNVRLVNHKKNLSKLVASPSFQSFRIFDENLAAVNMRKVSLFLNRPIYVGLCILDLSKVLMYDFHYNHIKAKYGENAKLLFTDTDSLCYEIKTHDIYRDFNDNIDLYDTSEYPSDHFLFNTRNKKVIGKMKDETHGVAIEEFIGLRPKMYSICYTENKKSVEKKTAKGIAKNITKNVIRHNDYKECLFDQSLKMTSMKQIRSDHHQLYSISLNKIGLSPYDDKRYILPDGVATLAHGHYSITNQ